MKKTFSLIGSVLVALGLKASTSVPARKETAPRPAIIKEICGRSSDGALQQKQPTKSATKAPAKAAYLKNAAQTKSAALKAAPTHKAPASKAPAPRTIHR